MAIRIVNQFKGIGAEMGRSKETTDFWGKKVTVHYDDNGDEVGRSKAVGTDFWGKEVTVHYDDNGEEVGRSKVDGNDFWGKEVTRHYNDYGEEVGRSKSDTDWLCREITRHYDDYGHQIGHSRKHDPDFIESLVNGSTKSYEKHFDRWNNPSSARPFNTIAHSKSTEANHLAIVDAIRGYKNDMQSGSRASVEPGDVPRLKDKQNEGDWARSFSTAGFWAVVFLADYGLFLYGKHLADNSEGIERALGLFIALLGFPASVIVGIAELIVR